MIPQIAIERVPALFPKGRSEDRQAAQSRHLQMRLDNRPSIGNVLLRKMIPDTFPLLVGEPNHSAFISDRQRSAILR
jgi:hypothetical protein